MKNLLILLLTAVLSFSCLNKPLRYADIHVQSLPEANEGKSLPVHIIPVDDALYNRIASIKPEEWFVDDMVETTRNIQKLVFRGRDTKILRVERLDNKNNFLVVTDFANTKSTELQRVYIGERYWREKAVYLLVTRDTIRIVDKERYERNAASN